MLQFGFRVKPSSDLEVCPNRFDYSFVYLQRIWLQRRFSPDRCKPMHLNRIMMKTNMSECTAHGEPYWVCWRISEQCYNYFVSCLLCAIVDGPNLIVVSIQGRVVSCWNHDLLNCHSYVQEPLQVANSAGKVLPRTIWRRTNIIDIWSTVNHLLWIVREELV